MGPGRISEPAASKPELSRRRRWLKRLRRLAVVCAVLAILYLSRSWLLPPFARFLDVSELPRRSDCVMVLGGGRETRPFVAAALVNASLARKVLVPSVKPSLTEVEGGDPSEHEILIRALRVRGVPAEDIILLPAEVTSTLDEARALAEYVRSKPNLTIAVVTNTYHTRRARQIFRRILGEEAGRVYFVGAPTDHYDATNWWQSESGFIDYILEYGKLALSWLHFEP